jgi:hypothetical protein
MRRGRFVNEPASRAALAGSMVAMDFAALLLALSGTLFLKRPDAKGRRKGGARVVRQVPRRQALT